MADYPLHIRHGTQRKIYVSIGLKVRVCFSFKNSNGEPARVHMHRFADRRGKDLDIHVGGRCLNSKGFTYEVFARALDEDVYADVTSEEAKPFDDESEVIWEDIEEHEPISITIPSGGSTRNAT